MWRVHTRSPEPPSPPQSLFEMQVLEVPLIKPLPLRQPAKSVVLLSDAPLLHIDLCLRMHMGMYLQIYRHTLHTNINTQNKIYITVKTDTNENVYI